MAGSLLITLSLVQTDSVHQQKRQRLVNSETISGKTDKERNLSKLAREKIAQLSKIQENTCAEVGLKLPAMNLVRNKKEIQDVSL